MPSKVIQASISAKFPKLPPRKPKNVERRSREYHTQAEVEKVRKAVRDVGRHGHRDDTLIL